MQNKWIVNLLITFLLFTKDPCNGDTHVCNANNQCPTEINCTENENCIVQCSSDTAGVGACQDKTINCPSAHECEVHCTNPLAINQCLRITIHAELSSYLLVNVSMGNSTASLNYLNESNTDPKTIQNSNIYCPQNGPFTTHQDIACHINCDGDDLFRYSEIYAVEGFNDVNITAVHYHRNWCFRNVDINCKPGFDSLCVSDTDNAPNYPNSCNGGSVDQTCNDYITTNSPTISPTEPTSDPTVTPTEPSNSPTVNPVPPTHSPTNMPSMGPSISPTDFPTSDPSVTPTTFPTRNPSVTPTITPSMQPSTSPSNNPSVSPTDMPTTNNPTTNIPTESPTAFPSNYPTLSPITGNPTTNAPSTLSPTTNTPTTNNPTVQTDSPTTQNPTTDIPTTDVPTTDTPTTDGPTLAPITTEPTLTPSNIPSAHPTEHHTTETYLPTPVITMEHTIGADAAQTDGFEFNLDLFNISTIVAGILILGIGCFGAGVCFGVLINKKKRNAREPPEMEHQLSTFVNESVPESDDRMNGSLVNLPQTDAIFNSACIVNTEDDHESLYADEIFQANKSIEISKHSKGTAGTAGGKHHDMVDSDSMIMDTGRQTINFIPPQQSLLIHQANQVKKLRHMSNTAESTGEMGADMLDLNDENGSEDEFEPHNPPQVLIGSDQNIRQHSSSLHAPVQRQFPLHQPQQQMVQQRAIDNANHNNNNPFKSLNNHVSEASVNYKHVDHEIEEKDNKRTKKGTPGVTITLQGISQPDVFPDDDEFEGASVAKDNDASVGYNSLKNIGDDSTQYKSDDDDDDDAGYDHYNSDPNEDEDEKNVQNEATLGIEIEMQTNKITKQASDNDQINDIIGHKKGELSKTLDHNQGYEEDDGIAPLNMSRISKSGQHLLGILSPNQRRKLDRSFGSKSKTSEVSASHKTGHSFITLFQEQKDDHDIDDFDDDGLDDPEAEQEKQLKIEQNINGGY